MAVPVDQVYREEVKRVLIAARDLEEALDVGDTDDVTSLASNLLSSALARESGSVVAGFRADDATAAHSAVTPSTVEEELSLALAELQVGEVLLTSAAATESQRPVASAELASALSDVIDRLDDASDRLAHVGAPAVLNLFGDRQLRPQDFFDQLPKTVDSIVKRTVDLGLDTVKGLTKIPAAQLQPVFGTALTAVETASGAAGEVGALARAGMRAVARALQALIKLVPEKLRQQVRDWAKEWWEQHALGVAEDLIRRVLSVAELLAVITPDIEAAKKHVKAAKKRSDIGPALKQGARRLIELDEQHARVIKVIERIVGALSRLIGPLVMVFPVAAPWIYGSGGGGMVIALGVSVWVGRDYLDTGVPFERVPGVRTIVSDATVMPRVSRLPVPSATAVVLGRIEMERGRLYSARRAMDDVAASMPVIGLATRANLVLTIDSTDDELEKLAARTRKGGVKQNRLENLTKLTNATDRVVREAFALATGTLARSQGLDDGACAEADRLLAELANVVDDRLARPTVPGDAEFLHRAADVIRRRLPDHGVWDLPVMAHEFGHVLAAHLQLYDPIDDQVLKLGDIVLGGWPGYSGTQGEELFCDLLATYAMGPSYGCTMLLHRLDPVADIALDPATTHPPDATRAAVVLDVLALLTKGEPDDSRYRMTYFQLSAAWRELQQEAPEKSRLTSEQADGVMTQVRVVLDFLNQKLKPLRYDWPSAEIRELADALKENRPPTPGLNYRIRDVLNAAWRLRLSSIPGNPLSAHIEARARALICTEHKGGLAQDA